MPACCDADYISGNALGISVNGADMPTQQFLTLPSSFSNDNLSISTMTSEADSSCKALLCFRSFVKAEHCHYLARPGSPEQTGWVWDTQSNAL